MDWSRSLSVNMKNYISILCPLRNYAAFISGWELQPIENFSRLIVVNHLLVINLNKSSWLSYIRLNLRQAFIDPPAEFRLFILTSQESINKFIFDHWSFILNVIESCCTHSTISLFGRGSEISILIFFFFLFYTQIKS